MKYFISSILFFISLTVNCQNREAGAFTGMVTDSNYIYALHKSGKLNVWNLKTLKKVYSQNDTLPKYTAIGKDRNGSVFLASSKGFVYKLNGYRNSTNIYKYKEDTPIHYIVFNPLNEMYLIIDLGVYAVEKDQIFSDFVNTGLGGISCIKFDENGRGKETNVFFTIPQKILIDSRGLLWMSKSFGEFGGTRNIFDTNTNSIIGDVPDVNLIQSFIEGADGVTYITCGLQHFMNFGSIYKVDANIKTIELYNSDAGFDNDTATAEEHLLIGPGAWNKLNKKLYFSSSEGFYSASISPENKLTDVIKLFEPILTANRENLAIGVQMPILEVSFTTDNRLIFRTFANGIGIHDGKELIMLN